MPVAGKSKTVRVLIVHGHRLFADSLKAAIDGTSGYRVTGIVGERSGAADAAVSARADVAVVWAGLPDALAAVREIRTASPETRVVVLADDEDESGLARAAQAGAVGWIPGTASLQDLVRAIRDAHRGAPLLDAERLERALERLRRERAARASIEARVHRLTPREVEVLQYLADGLAPSLVADALGMSRHTVRTHAQNILTKLGVHSRTEAVAVAIRYGKISVG